MVIFIELVQYVSNLGGKSRINLVEHQIIKMIRKFKSIFSRFFTPHSQENAFSLLHVWGAKKREMMLLNFLIIFYYLMLNQIFPGLSTKFFSHIAQAR